MALGGRSRRYDRSRILREASRARARGRRGKAARLLRRVLAVEPRNAELHARLASLLAERGQHFDAWQSYRAAAEGLLREGRVDRALGVLREATRLLPRKLEAWLAIAELLHKRERSADAAQTYLEARRRFRGRRQRPQAVFLLRRARALRPDDAAVAVDLARLLARSDQREEAILLLERLEERLAARPAAAQPGALRRVRRARFGITHALGDGWRWLAAPRGPARALPRPPVRGAARSS